MIALIDEHEDVEPNWVTSDVIVKEVVKNFKYLLKHVLTFPKMRSKSEISMRFKWSKQRKNLNKKGLQGFLDDKSSQIFFYFCVLQHNNKLQLGSNQWIQGKTYVWTAPLILGRFGRKSCQKKREDVNYQLLWECCKRIVGRQKFVQYICMLYLGFIDVNRTVIGIHLVC